MKKLFPVITALIAASLSVTGCDFFRALAGRPTSRDIEAKRELMKADSVRRADSIALVQAAAAASDTVVKDTAQATAEKAETAVKPAKKRFYVILGAFSSRENAERYARKIKGLGYEPEFFGFTEGRTAVGIGGTDDGEEAKAFMKELKRQDFCPAGIWILDRKRK